MAMISLYSGTLSLGKKSCLYKGGFQGLGTLETWPSNPRFEAKQTGFARPNPEARSQDVPNKAPKPPRSEPSSIFQQTGFVSTVVSGRCQSMETPIDKIKIVIVR